MFYRLYYGVAATKKLTALEKILISYILSFTDNGKRFWAKNAVVENILDISKEGFNTSRIKFEALGWITVKFPKTPGRELVIINHPTKNLASDLDTEASDNMSLNMLVNNSELPENNNELPVNNDNKINYQINDNRSIIRKDIIEAKNNNTIFSDTTSFDSTDSNETSSTKDASPEATVSSSILITGEEQSSTKEEANASTTHDEESTSTKKEATASTPLDEEHISTKEVPSIDAVNTIDDVATSSFSGTKVDEGKPFNAKDYLDNYNDYKKVRGYLTNALSKTAEPVKTMEEADRLTQGISKSQLDFILAELKLL